MIQKTMRVLTLVLALAVAAPMVTSSPAFAAKKKTSKKKESKKKGKESKAEEGGKHPKVKISTSMGDITVELDRDKAPVSVKNFLAYIDKKHYDGTIFHRVISSFMIQGGEYDKGMKDKPCGEPIKNEAGNGLRNTVGTLAMARTNVVDSATCQFFINTKDNSFLDHRDETSGGFGYAVFGKVTSGIEVVHKIEGVATGSKDGMADVPNDAVIIKSVRLLKK
jgi:cyclophilin family peptidyl-prolyl cis-trans isomerase